MPDSGGKASSERRDSGKPGLHPVARALKLIGAFGVVGIGAYAVLSEQGYVATDNAVVSAYLFAVRTPIDGYVTGITAHVGQEVHAGEILGSVENPRVDDQRLADLRSHLKRVQADRASAARQLAYLIELRDALLAQAEEHGRATTEKLEAEVEGVRKSLEAKTSERDQAKADFIRKAALVQSNVASRADFDRARAAFEIADRQVASLQAQLRSAEVQAQAAAGGVLIDPGANDKPYSGQRADEVAMHIARTEREISTLAAEEEETAARLATEERRIRLLRGDRLSAPATGMLWKLGASNGERLGAGQMAAEVVDCGNAFILADVPQNQFSSIEIGTQARFRFTGDDAERTGRVLSVTGERALDTDLHMAAAPVNQHTATATVRIAAPASRNVAGECLVGRTARVLLPASTLGLIARAQTLLQRIF